MSPASSSSKLKRKTSVTYVPDRSKVATVVGIRKPSVKKRQTTIRPITFELSDYSSPSSSAPANGNVPSLSEREGKFTFPVQRLIESGCFRHESETGSELTFSPVIESPLPRFGSPAESPSLKTGSSVKQVVQSHPPEPPLRASHPLMSRIPILRRLKPVSTVRPMNVGQDVPDVQTIPSERGDGGEKQTAALQTVSKDGSKLNDFEHQPSEDVDFQEPDFQSDVGDDERRTYDPAEDRTERISLRSRASDHQSGPGEILTSAAMKGSPQLEMVRKRRTSALCSSVPNSGNQTPQIQASSSREHARGMQSESRKPVQQFGHDKCIGKHFEVTRHRSGSPELHTRSADTRNQIMCSSVPSSGKQTPQIEASSSREHTRGMQSESRKPVQKSGHDKSIGNHSEVPRHRSGSSESQTRLADTRNQNMPPIEKMRSEVNYHSKERYVRSYTINPPSSAVTGVTSVEPDDDEQSVFRSQRSNASNGIRPKDKDLKNALSRKSSSTPRLDAEKTNHKHKKIAKDSALPQKKKPKVSAVPRCTGLGETFCPDADSLVADSVLSSTTSKLTFRRQPMKDSNAVVANQQSFQMTSVSNHPTSPVAKGTKRKMNPSRPRNVLPNANDGPLEDLVLRLRPDFYATSSDGNKRLLPSISNLTELDVVLSTVNKVISQYTEVDLQNTSDSAAMFFHQFTESLLSKISHACQISQSIQSLSKRLNTNKSVLKKKRQELLQLQVEHSRLEMEIAKKAQEKRSATASSSSNRENQKDIDDFLFRLKHLGTDMS